MAIDNSDCIPFNQLLFYTSLSLIKKNNYDVSLFCNLCQGENLENGSVIPWFYLLKCKASRNVNLTGL